MLNNCRCNIENLQNKGCFISDTWVDIYKECTNNEHNLVLDILTNQKFCQLINKNKAFSYQIQMNLEKDLYCIACNELALTVAQFNDLKYLNSISETLVCKYLNKIKNVK